MPKPEYAKLDFSYTREVDGILSLKEADYRITSATAMLGWYPWDSWPLELGLSGRGYYYQIDESSRPGFREHSLSIGLAASIAKEFRFSGLEDAILSFRIYASVGKMWPDEELPGLNEKSILGDFGGIIELEFPISKAASVFTNMKVMHQSKFSRGDMGLNSIGCGLGLKISLDPG